MQKPLITVIISSYNHAPYIKQLIETIVNQSYGYKNIELLVFDDCSSDNSVQILQELSDLYQFVFIPNKVNKGICANINKGIALSKGKYICITGSDDLWALDKLDKQVAHMEKNPLTAVCSGNVIRIDTNGQELSPEKQLYAPAKRYNFENVFLRAFPFSSTCAMIRKSVFEVVGVYDETLKVEDYYMWLKIAFAGYPLDLLEDTLGYYRIHETNSIHNAMKIYSQLSIILSTYANHPLYDRAIKRLKVVYFPQIAKTNKKKAWTMLPAAISNTRFFYRGLYNLLTP